MTAVLLDTHVLYWWSTDPDLLSVTASETIDATDDIAVAAVTWFELAWLATHGRIAPALSLRTWLETLSEGVRTIPLTPAIALTAVTLPDSFPADPADRQIYATAIENGLMLVTKDTRLRAHPHPRELAVW